MWRIEKFETLPSTQTLAKQRAAAGAAEGLVIQALMQTAGQGRHGRSWQSLAGNLYLSMILRPKCPVRKIGQLSLLSGLALASITQRATQEHGRRTRLKWPNDVLLDGLKCAGILLETELEHNGDIKWLVIGIGLNIAQAPEGASALSLPGKTKPAEPADVLTALLAEFQPLYEVWQQGGFTQIHRDWLALAHRPEEKITVKIGTRLEQGTFQTIDEFGNLIMRNEDLELKTITAGDVYLEQ
ncbi:MAG: biotin--[acetyl-CoA-carboxylase] ligase [Alphaproteobacteria bacterium]|nr:biotin--[acetyl-CoA-carboxylase] ligase [Alphaproteobacteria bacterium]